MRFKVRTTPLSLRIRPFRRPPQECSRRRLPRAPEPNLRCSFLGSRFACVGLARLLSRFLLSGRSFRGRLLGGLDSRFVGGGFSRLLFGSSLFKHGFLGGLSRGGGLGRSSSGLGGFGFLRGASFDALLGLLAWLRLLRVAARRPLLDPGRVEETEHAIRRLSADAQPVLDPIGVHLHPVRRVLRQQRIVNADLLDEAAIARVAAVGDNDAVIGPLLCAAARETD
jgi:hypothetical protein